MERDLDRQRDGHPTGSTLMAALDRELPPRQHSTVEEHLAKCPQCAPQWERLQQVSGRLTEFHRSIASLPEFELQLPSHEKRTSAVGGILALFRRPRFFAAAAALAMAVVGFVLWTNPRAGVRPASPAPPVINVPAETTAKTASRPETTAAPQTQAAAIRSPRRSRTTASSRQADLPQRAPNPEVNAVPPQTAEVFWYLPYSDPALVAEGAEVVRADLPREAFLMAGVPLANIPAGGPKDRIAADIVIGADGLPRAIRPARQQTTATVIPTRL